MRAEGLDGQKMQDMLGGARLGVTSRALDSGLAAPAAAAGQRAAAYREIAGRRATGK